MRTTYIYKGVGVRLRLFHRVHSPGLEPPVRPGFYHDDRYVVLAPLLEGAAPPLRRIGAAAVVPVTGQNPIAGRGADLLVGHDVSQVVVLIVRWLPENFTEIWIAPGDDSTAYIDDQIY